MPHKLSATLKDAITKDWHMHDCMSHDAVGTPLEHALAAQKRGLKSICITNHVEQFDKETGRYEIIPSRDIPRLQNDYEMILEAREQCPDMEILFGVELENNPPFYGAMLEITAALEFDLVIGSVHRVKDVVFSSSNYIEQQRACDPAPFYHDYYREVLEFVQWGHFDILGHLDLIRRYMVQVHPDVKPVIPHDQLRRIFAVMKEKEIALEINVGGYFQPPKDCYPTREIIDLAIECGIENFTMGSDAHRPEHVGCGYDEFINTLL